MQPVKDTRDKFELTDILKLIRGPEKVDESNLFRE